MLAERIARHDWYHRTIPQLFAQTCALQPERVAIIFDGREIRYREFWDDVQHVAQALLDLGLDRGDVVSTLPSPTPEFATLYFATLQVGAMVNPLNLLWGSVELRGVLQRNAPKLIVAVERNGPRDVLQLLKDALPDLTLSDGEARAASLPSLRHLACVSRTVTRHADTIDFTEFTRADRTVEHERMQVLVETGQPTDLQFICQTSGTTGMSKSALWDHRAPLATVNFAARNLGYTDDERYANLAPFYHNSGLFALNLNLALAGTTLVLMESFVPALALELIERHACTATFGFDAHWQGLRRVPGFEQRRFTIAKAILAGEPRTYDLVKSMCPPGSCIDNLYAQTENGPLVSLAEHDCVDETINKYTHGRPLPGVQVVIKHIDTGQRLPQGEAGEICYKSPFMFRGYLKQPDETDASFDAEGYFHSGDYGHLDNGYLTFLGRLGGVVKSGGENVSTARVTTLLLDLFPEDFDDVKTVGIDDAYWGAKVVSFVRMRADRSMPGSLQLREACKGRMAAYEIPREFLAWEGEWPVSPEGKIDFKRLHAQARERLGEG